MSEDATYKRRKCAMTKHRGKLLFSLKTLGILVAGAMLGVLLLTAAFMIPVNQENAQASMELLEQEGWYPAVPVMSLSLDKHFHSLLPGVLDDSTDRLMLQVALDQSPESALYRAMKMYYEGNGYTYYWHGYVSILRPLICLLDYGEIRVLNGILQLLIIISLVHFVWKKKGMIYGLLLFSSYILLMPTALSFSLQFSWVFYIGTVGCLLLLTHSDYFTGARFWYLFLALGMLTSFLDLLTYPLFTWGFPIIWWILLSSEDRIKTVIKSGLMWILGYGGMWILKWVFASVILHENIFQSGFTAVQFRSGLEVEGMVQTASRFSALYVNWKHYEYKLYAVLLTLWLIYFVVMSVRNGWRRNRSAPALLLAAVSPFVWYTVLANHTTGHHFFTYRVYGVGVLAVLAIGIGCLNSKKTEAVAIGRIFLRLVYWGVGMTAAFLCSLFARESERVLNGYCDYKFVELEQGGTAEFLFRPTYSGINKIGFGLMGESKGGGYYDIVLYEDGNARYQESVSMSDIDRDKNYYSMPVDWKLSKGYTYQICISARENSKGAGIMVTAGDQNPLIEAGSLHMAGEEFGGQPIMEITYNRLPGKKTLLFLTVSWAGLIMAGAGTCYACLGNKKNSRKGGRSYFLQ